LLFKRLLSGILCISVLFSMGWLQKLPVKATEPPDVQTEPLVTEAPTSDMAETEPQNAPKATEGSGETLPAQPQQTEPTGTVLPTDPKETISPTGPMETMPPMDQIETIPPTGPVAGEPTGPQIKETESAEMVLLEEEIAPVFDASAQDGDLGTAAGQGITFRLFNYSTDINKSAGATAWRAISSYFTFRNSRFESGADAASFPMPSPSTNSAHDQDGFTKNHATVERILDGGYPVLDLTRNADGSERPDPGVARSTRSLRYLFTSGDHAVTAYAPGNTILQQSGSHYWYDSADHAVDYDLSANRFRLRSYAERNSTTASYGTAYGDFLPFTYTGGQEQGVTEDGVPYHVDTNDTDYWFGMTMQVNFFQTKGGRLGDQNMVFRFSGDDDVWVFVDDVLVLDLGGTHGTVNGSIDFATGEILQYLSWGGANATDAERRNGSATSFPTTIRACFDAAGETPNGGWNASGQTFADYSEHTLKFFYLERGSAVANCSLDFRLPTLPDESLTVTKDLTTEVDTDVREYLADSLYYRFRVMKAAADGNATDEPFLTAGMTYTQLDEGVKSGTGTVAEDNTFQLKAGQSAQFTQMLRKGNGATQYVVEELMPDALTGQYAGVEYLVSGEGGDAATEDDPAEAFTSFYSPALSAEKTQTVTFRNRVDTRKLGTLKITKQAAPGTQIPEDLYFRIQVKLGQTLLPVGSRYSVADEVRTVEIPGVLLLRAGETAVVEPGILSGTVCHVTELSSSLDGYRAAYSGVVEPEGSVESNEDGASGTLPLSGTMHITIVNADYDFALPIPIQKTVLDIQKEESFLFLIEQVEYSGDIWQVVETLPETEITVTGPQVAEQIVTIGYRSHDEGVFYYRITEKTGSGSYLYDASVFFVEVTVADGKAAVTGIERNGMDAEAVHFTNRAVTSLTVTKTVTGGTGTKKFPFAVEVFLDGKPFAIPEPVSGAEYTVEGNRFAFSLGHDERITLPCIPIGATVKVEEQDYEGFLVSSEVEDGAHQQINGALREIQFSNTPQTIHFYNQTGFRLPNTGGTGTALYAAAGTGLCLSMGIALLYERLRRGRQAATPTHKTNQHGKDRNHESNS